ncbi:MAG: lipopolysaccharide assembly protein LapB [Limnohabitans sp.]|jgi:lipopolysaccharide biosynthesis regulator YciM|uniref:lipopolysaccharide assembly protein LapB n=1 Tax=Limnohabitans sp. TaxID=1907725 RepID=UPI001B5DEAC8|nr:lipopolysaccharide assembly protein LapB [Limnohabitans sp.]MBP6220340.1 lipopolysaccharide assembly protein LapB [Limnohabitans sp.]MBP6245365.1 lipopolysaccharide assembly protein LapB [Limnohabitans sp.]
MELDLTWILLGLPAAFALGWIASRLDLRQMRIANRQAPRAYFKGLNYLLNEQQDKAIDAFIEAVQNDPDTSELHFALGNLFRRRGEYDRAVRVHEHLMSRADLSSADRQRAQHGLALDFLKAGLLDRAEEALRKLEGTSYEGQARLARLAIYERSREWPEAARVARLLETSGEANFDMRMAHYQCEQAREAVQQGDIPNALNLLTAAIQATPDAARPRILLGQLQLSQGQAAQAFETLSVLFERSDAAAPLAAASLVKAAQAAALTQEAAQLLKTHYAKQACIDVLDAISAIESTSPEGGAASHQRYLDHLSNHASLMAATRWLTEENKGQNPLPAPVQKALEQAIRPLARYRCAACGFEAKEHFWHCPGCQAWDSYPPRRIEEL